MIFYFSGTGNSLQVAKSIAEYNDEKIISIASVMNNKDSCFEYTLMDNEVIGFVFPIYAWAPPEMIIHFIKKLKFINYKDNYIFSVVTCGKNIGNTMKVIDKCLIKKNMHLSSGFSIIMPNNYIFTGDVDSKEVEAEKLHAAQEALKSINRLIKEKNSRVFEVEKGSFPKICTYVINPAFNKFAISTKNFSADDKCTGCGICEKVCNCKSIKVDGKPHWGKKCTQCLSCIHSCPVQAIQYGKATQNKGRYLNPNVNILETF